MKVSLLIIKDAQGNVIAEAELTFPTGEPERARAIYDAVIGSIPVGIDPREMLRLATTNVGIRNATALAITEQEKVPA